MVKDNAGRGKATAKKVEIRTWDRRKLNTKISQTRPIYKVTRTRNHKIQRLYHWERVWQQFKEETEICKHDAVIIELSSFICVSN